MSNSTISYFSFRKLLPVAGLLLLTGCPPLPVTLKTVTLQPTDLSYGDQYDHSWSNVCDVPQPLPTYGTGAPQTSSGETLAGWFDLWYPGANPVPCNNAYQTIVRGHVRFDLRQFDAVADASLTLSVDQSESNSMGTAGDSPPQGYATVLGMSTGQSQGDNGPYWWDYDNDVALPVCQGDSFVPCTVDVSVQANLWTTQQHFNWGFIIAGPKLSLDGSIPQDNNAALTWYGSPRLTILYNPALNPRAPQ